MLDANTQNEPDDKLTVLPVLQCKAKVFTGKTRTRRLH